jgi:hypothetical protein
MQEVGSLRMNVASAEQNAESSELEQQRLSMWLKEARNDSENAQERLTKRVAAIRAELEAGAASGSNFGFGSTEG